MVDLIAVKPTAKVGDAVTFLARVGGRAEPFVDGTAVFVVADPALESCELVGEDDHCPIPWDYCCTPIEDLKAGMATIRIVDGDGMPYPASAQGAGGLAPARFVVIDGVVSDRNDDGVFVVDAGRIWVGGRPEFGKPRLGSAAGEPDAPEAGPRRRSMDSGWKCRRPDSEGGAFCLSGGPRLGRRPLPQRTSAPAAQRIRAQPSPP